MQEPKVTSVFLLIFLLTSYAIRTNALTSSGHEEVTVKAAENLGFSSAAREVLARGAMWPDFSDWDKPAAHAQTDNDNGGKPTQTDIQAETACGDYLQSTAGTMRDELNAKHFAVALFVLGVGLHTIQDFASHQGMTNAEHSYLSYDANPPQNPDLDSNNIATARQYTDDFLDAVHKELGDDKWNALQKYQAATLGDQLPDKFRSTTIGPITLGHYHRMGTKFTSQDQIRWNKPDVKTVENTLISNFVSGLRGVSPPTNLTGIVY